MYLFLHHRYLDTFILLSHTLSDERAEALTIPYRHSFVAIRRSSSGTRLRAASSAYTNDTVVQRATGSAVHLPDDTLHARRDQDPTSEWQ